MPFSDEDKAELKQMFKEFMTPEQPPADPPAPTPPADKPVTLDDIKSLLTDMNQTGNAEAKQLLFDQQKQTLFDQDPNFKKFFETATDWNDQPYSKQFDNIVDLKEQAQKLKNLHKNYLQASQSNHSGDPNSAAPRSPEEEKADEKWNELESKFHKGEITPEEFAQSHWNEFDALMDS